MKLKRIFAAVTAFALVRLSGWLRRGRDCQRVCRRIRGRIRREEICH